MSTITLNGKSLPRQDYNIEGFSVLSPEQFPDCCDNCVFAANIPFEQILTCNYPDHGFPVVPLVGKCPKHSRALEQGHYTNEEGLVVIKYVQSRCTGQVCEQSYILYVTADEYRLRYLAAPKKLVTGPKYTPATRDDIDALPYEEYIDIEEKLCK